MAVTEEESSSSSSCSWSASNKERSGALAGSNGANYLAKTVLRSSVVLQVVQGHIRFPSSNDIVFGKETSIELVIIDKDGIVQSICEQPVFGTIKDLAVLPWNEKVNAQNPEMHGKGVLVVISDSGKLSLLTFCNEMHRFFALTHIQLSTPGNSTDQIGRMLATDSNGCFIAASAYEDRLALFSVVSGRSGSDTIDKKIFYPPQNEQTICGAIWSMCFISKDIREENNPILAILLNRRRSYRNELLLLEWNIKEDCVNVIYEYSEPGPLSHHIVEVPHSYGFVFLLRAGDALLMDFRDAYNPCCVHRISLNFTPSCVDEVTIGMPEFIDEDGMYSVAASALLELSDINKSESSSSCMEIDGSDVIKPGSNYICSWSWELGNLENPRMIFCADSGEIYMIEIYFENSQLLKVNLSDCLYKCLPTKSLLWLEGGFITAIVEMGDGMVLQLLENEEEKNLLFRSPIQNIAPILDMSVVDYHDEKHDQMFACCGVAPEGSFRVIRSGISVEKLLKTAPIYQGITSTWTMKMKHSDVYHSFLVLSFVEETRVLSVGLSFCDVTDSVGFKPDVCTLACGLVCDNVLVQIHQNAVRVCVPNTNAHTSWSPPDISTSISLGAVGCNMIVVATSNPCYLFILGVKSSLSVYHYQVYQMRYVRLQNEVSCISIPTKCDNNIFVIGTHKPSVEVVSFTADKGLRIIGIGTISVAVGSTSIGGCVPQDVRLVQVDRLYVLCGLRNGMLLRYEWPFSSSSTGLVNCFIDEQEEQDSPPPPIYLQLIAVRRIGITPAFLVSLNDSLDSDIIVLSDRPWLLQTARHSLSYMSISFQPSTHVTPVSSNECPKGILFVADNSLHLVEMVHSKRLNVQKFDIGGTPRKVLYHSESRLVLILRTELNNDSYSSDVCCIDPLSGLVLSSFKFEPGETGKCMELIKVENEHLLVVGTSLSSGSGCALMPSGEAESSRGRLVLLCLEHSSPFSGDENSAWRLRLSYSTIWPGMVVAVCSYLDRYFLASAGNAFYVCSPPNDNSPRVKRLAIGRTRYMIITLSSHFTRIAVGDSRDGILFYSYHEDARKLDQLYSDPCQRIVADCILMDLHTAVVSDKKGSIAVLSSSSLVQDNASPERNLAVTCSYYMGEIAMSIRKGSFSYKLPTDDSLRSSDIGNTLTDLTENSIMATTLLGSIITFIPLTREEYEVLEAVQGRLVIHPLTSPILGNDHTEFRSRESWAIAGPKMLDGDMLAQFLELTSLQQESVLSSLPLITSHNTIISKPPSLPLSVNQVVRLLERVHYALN